MGPNAALDGLSDTQCQALGTALRRRIRRYLGLPVCIGLAPTHTLAKLANHLAKKQPHYAGVCLLHGESATTQAVLKQLPVSDVWGVGRRLAGRLLPGCESKYGLQIGLKRGLLDACRAQKRVRSLFSTSFGHALHTT